MDGDDHDHHDGCLCDLPHDESLTTHDEDLPASTGGVEGDLKPPRKSRPKATRGEAK